MGDLIDLGQRRAERWAGEPWLTKRLAAAHLGVSLSTIERWQRSMALPHRRVGGRNLYRRSELDAWVDRQHLAGCGDDAM